MLEMILIEDYDLPITVANKIITGTRPSTASQLTKAMAKAVTGSDEAGETEDMFTIEEIKEIADYLMVYCQSQRWRLKNECNSNGDGHADVL